MNMYGIFLTIIIQLPNPNYSIGTCSPNSQFIINGLLCICNVEGVWNQLSCKLLGRRSACAPREVIRRGCSRCTCYKGNFLCDHTLCPTTISSLPAPAMLSYFSHSCTPLRSYYVNCSLCICPASGMTSEAQCVIDLSCPFIEKNYSDKLRSSAQNICMPNVIYLFPCMQCLCSETGTFVYEKCVDKCHNSVAKTQRRCIPGSMHRVNCTVCRCPENGVHDDAFCEKIECSNRTSRPVIRTLQIRSTSCSPHAFTEPKCYYCDCTPDGIVNDYSCIQIPCTQILLSEKKYSSTCIPGEVTPLCIECFCLRNKSIKNDYCTRNCSEQSKLEVLEKVLNNSFDLIDDKQIAKVKGNEKCEPNFLYLDENRYCLCVKGNSSMKVCTLYYRHSIEPPLQLSNVNVEIDYDAVCKPSTLVEFGCNVCFCSKLGRIDAKWCTADDCEAIRAIQESHGSHPVMIPLVEIKSTCHPGTISKIQCNYCICPETGLSKDRVCTKNECEETAMVSHDDLICEPLSYYKVDCNVCLCPKDGLKNVAKCTKNVCETNFLRTDHTCTPGHLFVEDCNICVCPISGRKEDMACTNHLCERKTWNFLKTANVHISQMNAKRNLDVCFPGEEYVQGCDLCVCPEEGLKAYGICEDMACNQNPFKNVTTSIIMENSEPTELVVLEGAASQTKDPITIS